MNSKTNIEIKKINEDFSVFKYQTEDYIKYGLCFNYELEDIPDATQSDTERAKKILGI